MWRCIVRCYYYYYHTYSYSFNPYWENGYPRLNLHKFQIWFSFLLLFWFVRMLVRIRRALCAMKQKCRNVFFMCLCMHQFGYCYTDVIHSHLSHLNRWSLNSDFVFVFIPILLTFIFCSVCFDFGFSFAYCFHCYYCFGSNKHMYYSAILVQQTRNLIKQQIEEKYKSSLPPPPHPT